MPPSNTISKAAPHARFTIILFPGHYDSTVSGNRPKDYRVIVTVALPRFGESALAPLRSQPFWRLIFDARDQVVCSHRRFFVLYFAACISASATSFFVSSSHCDGSAFMLTSLASFLFLIPI